MKFSSANAKLAKTATIHGIAKAHYVSFNLPAQKTCPSAGNCKNWCYASTGTYLFPSSVNLRLQNFDWLRHTKNIEIMANEIHHTMIRKNKRIRVVRIHDSGDFFSTSYLYAWIKVARWNPDKLFYAYTKEVKRIKELIAEFGDDLIPSNLTLIFSFGGRHDHMIDTENDYNAKVFATRQELESSGYVDTGKDDLTFLKTKKIGLVVHGRLANKFKSKEV